MNYRPQIFDTAKYTLEERRRKAEEEAAKNLREFHARCPKALELSRAIQSTGSRAAVAVVQGGNVREELTKLKEANLSLQAQYSSMLKAHGLSMRGIRPDYSCKQCKDTGYIDGYMCACLKQLLKKLSFEELNRKAPLELCGFDQFKTGYFEDYPREQRSIMEGIFNYCKSYAGEFSLKSPNLLFQGGTGLGKTHLSLAIAGAAIEKGYGVIYGSVHSFALAIEQERFQNPEETSAMLSSCDLLILDDLGTEFTSSYTQSAIYCLIDTRIMRGLPTIISTNLSAEELQKRYSERLISRLFGSYNRLGFWGKDIRSVRKLRG